MRPDGQLPAEQALTARAATYAALAAAYAQCGQRARAVQTVAVLRARVDHINRSNQLIADLEKQSHTRHAEKRKAFERQLRQQNEEVYEQRRELEEAKRDVFLATMEAIVPWAALCAAIEPHYPKAGNGRPPVGLERMLRMYFVQHWFNLADVACEDALLDSTALRHFVGRHCPRA
jgi:Tfp pilus assembly protein PilN